MRTNQNPEGVGFSAKKKVQELPQTAGLVGCIIEKGFSSAPKSHRNLPPASFPQPTVVPFPVARHRSHGPHWAPAGTEPIADEDGAEDDDDKDYEPISSFANPVERKKKKGLDFSRWKDFIPGDDSAPPQPKKREAKTNTGKEGKKNFLPIVSSSGTDVVDRGDTLEELRQRSSDMEPVTRAERKPDHNDSISIGEGSPVLMDDIDVENLARLREMPADEIAEAQAEIMEKMDPAIIEMLKKRGRDKLGKKKGSALNRDKGQLDMGSDWPVGGGKRSKMVASPGDWATSGESNSSSWKVWSERVERVRALRFSLEGNVMQIDSTQEQSNGNKRDCGQYNVENVSERDFLRTEGDPAAVGYTIKEAVALTRSMVPGQRALALQLLASIFSKALHNLQRKDIRYSMGKANPIDELLDWQAVWAFALGPEPQMPLSLRIALDDNHDSVVLACLKVIQCILSCDINENFFNITEKVPILEKDIFTAPVFRSRPEVDGGFLHGGFWKYNTKPSNILPSNNENEDDENEGKHTIQDDIVVAGQDVVAGLIRMGILPRICYLLEMDPLPKLEECLVSILIALARHSPSCANAIMICPRLVQTVVKMFTRQGIVGIPSQIKAIVLLKVLSQSDKQICSDFVRRGVFRQAMWHWYRSAFTLEHWVESGREHCKLTSTLMVEQLRLWKVCIRYGYCISYFEDFFHTMCLWLSPTTFDKLVENNVLDEFTSITREAYLVLEALAKWLPSLHSMDQLNKQAMNISDNNVESWSWSYVAPMVDLAIDWLALKNIPYVSSVIVCHRGSMDAHDSSASCMIWVISAVLHMLCSIINRIAPGSTGGTHNSCTPLPWLPHFVPKVGLEIVKNGFLNFVGLTDMKPEVFSTEGGSLAEGLSYLRHQNDFDLSLSSVSCLHGLVRLALSVDNYVQSARNACYTQSLKGDKSGIADKILEEGIVKWAQNDLTRVLTGFMTLVSSEWHVVQSVEMFGRGGPAPGVGLGWGSSGGGFWSLNVLLAQVDAQLILELFEIFPIVLEEDLAFVEGMKAVVDRSADAVTLALQRINSVLAVCLVTGPRDRATLEKALNILLQAPVLKYLSFCVHYFLHCNKQFKSFEWQYKEGDYLFFSKILNSHFRDMWLNIKRKSSGKVDRDSHSHKISRKSNALETIHEDQDTSEMAVKDPDCSSLLIEWAHQRLPLPAHWFLSAICSIGDAKNISMCSSADVVDVAKSGLFLLLGLEAMSSFLHSDSQDTPISRVPLVWKLHALSMALHVSMDVLEEVKSRDVFEALQELYGQHLDKLRYRDIMALQDKNETLPEAQYSGNLDLLNFQTKIHGSYTTFVENLIELFGAISYGDIIYGRQVALYLHRSVEAPVRLAAWNALSNAHVLELLPPLGKCFAEAEGYLEPVEDNETVLDAYAKSWISGGLDRAADRGSVCFTLALHHLSCFIFKTSASDNLSFRNKLAKSLLRGHSHKQQHEGMLLNFIQYELPISQDRLYRTETIRRFELLKEACEGNSSLLAKVDKLKTSV